MHRQLALIMNLAIFICLLSLNSINGKLYYIEVKYPLLVCVNSCFFFRSIQLNLEIFFIIKKAKSASKLAYDASLPLWPYPQHVNNTSTGRLLLSKENFNIYTNLRQSCDLIAENIKHYTNIIFPPNVNTELYSNTKEPYLDFLFIDVESQGCPGYPNSNMDESCMFNLFFVLKIAQEI
jgi:hypothetical protein